MGNEQIERGGKTPLSAYLFFPLKIEYNSDLKRRIAVEKASNFFKRLLHVITSI